MSESCVETIAEHRALGRRRGMLVGVWVRRIAIGERLRCIADRFRSTDETYFLSLKFRLTVLTYLPLSSSDSSDYLAAAGLAGVEEGRCFKPTSNR